MKYYSQFGEDQYIVENLVHPKIGVFVDVGAGNGIDDSNTMVFEDMGWDGICIEPDSRNFAKCREYRKRSLNFCISDVEEDMVFYCHKVHPDLSGLGKNGLGYNKTIIRTHRLDTILKEQKINRIDVLSIDTEGTELDVMNSFDIEIHQPGIIIIEYITLRMVNGAIRGYFEKLTDYRMVRDHGSNLIYLRDPIR